MLTLLTGCAVGTIRESSVEKYDCLKEYHDTPTSLPNKIGDYTVNDYSYTLYNYLDTCYEIFLDITVTEEEFNTLITAAKEYSDSYAERTVPYADGYTEIVFCDEYAQGNVDKQDHSEQAGTAKIDKILYNAEMLNMIYVSFHTDDTDVFDMENIAYFNRFTIQPDQYIEYFRRIQNVAEQKCKTERYPLWRCRA